MKKAFGNILLVASSIAAVSGLILPLSPVAAGVWVGVFLVSGATAFIIMES